MKVGFIGLGTMGLPMTMNLLRAGYEVYVFSRSRGPIEKALSAGAMECQSAKELGEMVEIAFTCLPMPMDVETVYFGKNGLIAGANEGVILVDHSTVGPDLSRKINEATIKKGAHFLDAPVSGGPMGAEVGTLTIMCGGEELAFDRAKEALGQMGRNVLLMGPSGSGSIMKLINNQLFGIHTVALAEAMLLAEKTDIDLEKVYTVLKSSTGNSAILDWVFPKIKEHDFDPKFKINLLLKDMNIAGEIGKEIGLPMTVAASARVQVRETKESGYGNLDVSAVYKPIEEKYK